MPPSEPRSLAELAQLREDRAISRDEHWLEARRFHVALEDYVPRLARSGSRLLLDGDGIVVETRDGLLFAWNPAELRTAPSVLINDGAYEQRETLILLDLARVARTVIDVGANIGWYAVTLGAGLADGSILHAFEPVPATREVLKRNVALNGLAPRVVIHDEALSDSTGPISLYLPGTTGSVAASTAQILPGEANSEITCRSTTLDAWVTANAVTTVDLIKIDIEGGEFACLRGAEATIRGQRPTLFVEVLRKWSEAHGHSAQGVLDMLDDWGYECHAVGGGVDLITSMASVEATNFVFVARDRPAAVAAVLEALSPTA